VEVQGSVAPELESRKHFASRASRVAALKRKGLIESESGAILLHNLSGTADYCPSQEIETDFFVYLFTDGGKKTWQVQWHWITS